MAVIRNLVIRAGADFSQMRREMQRAQKDLKDFGGKMKSALGGLAAVLGGIAIGAGIKDAVDDAIKVEAAMQQVNRTMRENGLEFATWAKNSAGAFNMSRSEAIRFGAIYSNLVATFSTDTKKTMEYTQMLLKSSSIISAATGRDFQDVSERIRSGMLGNTEAVEDLGVNVQVSMMQSTDAFKKFSNGKSWDQLDFKVKSQILMFGILEQATKKYGDELASNTASRIGAFTMQLKNARLSLGQAFLPIINIILPSLTAFATALSNVMSVVAQFSQALFGKSYVSQAKATDAQAAAVGGLGDAYDETGKKAKKAANSLAGFDEVNQLGSGSSDDGNDDSAKAAGASPGLGVGGIGEATDEVSPKVQEMADKVKKAFGELSLFISGIKETIDSNVIGIAQKLATSYSGLTPVFQSLTGLKEPISAAFVGIGKTVSQLMDQTLIPMSSYLAFDFVPKIVTAFATSFAPIFSDTLVWAIQEFQKTFQNVTDTVARLWNGTWLPSLETLKAAFLDTIPSIANSLQSLLDGTIKPLVDYVLNQFIIPINEAVHSTLVPIFTDIAVAALEQFASTFKWVVTLINDVWVSVGVPVFDLVKKIVLDTLNIIKGLWGKYGADTLKDIKVFIDGVQDTFQKLWDVVLKPIIQPFLEMLSWLWDKHIKGLVEQVGEFIFKLVDGALEIYNGFIKPILDWLIDVLGPGFRKGFNLLVDIVGSFVGMLADVLSGVFTILGGVVDFIVGIFTGNWGKAWKGVVEIFTGIVEVISGIFKGVLNVVIDVINASVQSVMESINGLIQGAISMINAVPGVNIKLEPIKVPKIPKLARGGIVDGATNMGNYVAGEAGSEMIVPLENTSFVEKVASALGTAVLTAMQMGASNKGGSGETILNIDGTTIARVIGPYLNKENNRIGGGMITTS